VDIELISVPYDSALRNARMGAGPTRLIEAGLLDHLAAAGHGVTRTDIEAPSDALPAEIATGFQLMRRLAERIRAAGDGGRFPIVLAGNCNTSVGTVAGLDGPVAVVWFDSHADFNTPETTPTGFLDGMGLATLVGRCWEQLTRGVPGFAPVEERNAVLAGARDLDPLEAELLADSDVKVLSPAQVRDELGASLRPLRERVTNAYVHIDLDVLDSAEGMANSLASPGGLTLAEVRAAIGIVGRDLKIAAAALASYDPSFDNDGRICRAAFTLIDTILEAV
jgi:arginase